MTNRTTTDMLDTILYAAAVYAGQKEIDEYNAIDISDTLSEETEKRMLKRLKQNRKRIERTERIKKYSPRFRGLKNVAVIALVIMSLGFTFILSIKAVRQALWDTFIEWRENSIFVKYERNDPGEDTDFYISEETGEDSKTEENNQTTAPLPPNEILEYKEPSNIGNDFMRYETHKGRNNYNIEYESVDSLITYTQCLLDQYEVHLSNYDTTLKEITLNGYKGVFTYFVTNGIQYQEVLWTDGYYAYKLSGVGNITEEILLGIAKNVK